MNFDIIRNSRTYKYLVSVGLLQISGYLLCLVLYVIYAITNLEIILMLIAVIIIFLAVLTIVLTLITPIIFLIDTLKPLKKNEHFSHFGLKYYLLQYM